jgi:hypothetical protein
VITVRQGVATDLTGVRQRLEERPGLLATGSMSVLWAVLDAVVDAYAPRGVGGPCGGTGSPAPCGPEAEMNVESLG